MAGVLTVNLVLQKARVDDVQRVQKLNVCAAQLQDIGVLRHAINLQVLSLSMNEISELGALSACTRLREVYLRRNRVVDANQVLHLTRLPHLEVLNLSDNPVSADPNYRSFVIAAVPSLRRLDDVDISAEERGAAVRVFPELTRFAPPASPYAEPVDGCYLQPPQQMQHTASSSSSSLRGGATRRVQGQPLHTLGGRQRTRERTPETPDHYRNGNATAAAGSSAAGAAAQHRRSPLGGSSARRGSGGASGAYNNNNHSKTRRSSSATTPTHGRAARASVPSASGPSEAGVLQAVKVLCAELSPRGLDEVRRFLDSMRAAY